MSAAMSLLSPLYNNDPLPQNQSPSRSIIPVQSIIPSCSNSGGVSTVSFDVTFSTCQEAKSPAIISELSEASSSGYMSLFGKQFSEERSVRNILDPLTHGCSPTGWVSIFYVWRSEEGAVFLFSHTDLKLDRTLSDCLRECLVSTKMELFIDTCCLCGKLSS
jgi:hypothetical protein